METRCEKCGRKMSNVRNIEVGCTKRSTTGSGRCGGQLVPTQKDDHR